MGFLSSMLPTIAGAGLMAASGGTINPMTAGLILGGLQTARTGSLQKGMMAGLGAYGGAGLASGLVGAGAQQVAGEQLAKEAAINAAQEGVALPSNYAQLAGQTATPAQIESARAGMSGFDAASKGLGAVQSGGFGAYQSGLQAAGGPSLGRAGLAAALPAMVQTTTQQPEVKPDANMGQRYSYSPGRPMDSQGRAVTPAPDVPGYGDLGRDFGRQQSYFDQRYTPIDNDKAKSLYGYANGGPVEEMSTANAVGANTGYPMADIGQSGYATPFQAPVSQNVVAGAQDVAVDPYTGQEQRTVPAPTARFADGGYTFDAENRKFTPTAQENDSGPRSIVNPMKFAFGAMLNPEIMPFSDDMRQKVLAMKQQYYGEGQQPETSKGYAFDPKTRRFVGAGTDANYLGGGQWGMDSAEQAAADAASAAAQSTQYAATGGLMDAYAAGGITGEGNLDLHIPLDFGSGGGYTPGNTGATTYQAAGSGNAASTGFTGYNNAANPTRQDMSSFAPSAEQAYSQLNAAGPTAGLGTKVAANSNMQGAYGDFGQAFDSAGLARPFANGGLMDAYAAGGMSHLGDYSDGGRLLKGPGDGVSDSIPATIGNKRPARLADGEFVVPARIVSELGNGSTEAGARKLYAMLDRVQAARKKSIGKGKVAKNSRADKLLPA